MAGGYMKLTMLRDSRCCACGGKGNFEGIIISADGLLIKEITFHEHAYDVF